MSTTNFVATLDQLGTRISERHGQRSDDLNFNGAAATQKEIRDRVAGLIAIHDAKRDEGTTLRAAEQLSKFSEKTAATVETSKLLNLAAMENNFYERSGLVHNGFGGEIRAYARSLNVSDRWKLTQDAIKNNTPQDQKVLAGLLHVEVPPVLTGFTPAQQKDQRDQFFKTVMPEAWKTREDYLDAVEHVEVSIRVAKEAAEAFSNPAKLADINERDEAARVAQERIAASRIG